MDQLQTTNSNTWVPHLDGERVVEGIHYGWLMKDHLARYRFAAKYTRRKRVLDVATGTGYGANILRTHGALEVVGVDRVQDVLDYASSRYGGRGMRWVNADAYELPFEQEFEAVVSFETIEHLKDPARFVEACKRALKPGGTFIVSTPESVGGPLTSPYHEFEYTRSEFRDFLRDHFRRVTLFGQRRELSERVCPLGGLPQKYWESHVRMGGGSHTLFKLMDRINKAPNHLMAWASGVGESYRQRIVPIDEPIRHSRYLKEHYFAMIGVCTMD